MKPQRHLNPVRPTFLLQEKHLFLCTWMVAFSSLSSSCCDDCTVCTCAAGRGASTCALAFSVPAGATKVERDVPGSKAWGSSRTFGSCISTFFCCATSRSRKHFEQRLDVAGLLLVCSHARKPVSTRSWCTPLFDTRQNPETADRTYALREAATEPNKASSLSCQDPAFIIRRTRAFSWRFRRVRVPVPSLFVPSRSWRSTYPKNPQPFAHSLGLDGCMYSSDPCSAMAVSTTVRLVLSNPTDVRRSDRDVRLSTGSTDDVRSRSVSCGLDVRTRAAVRFATLPAVGGSPVACLDALAAAQEARASFESVHEGVGGNHEHVRSDGAGRRARWSGPGLHGRDPDPPRVPGPRLSLKPRCDAIPSEGGGPASLPRTGGRPSSPTNGWRRQLGTE